MGYFRDSWEKNQKTKKLRQRRKIKNGSYREPVVPSLNADNRFVCPKTGRMKYCYETPEKALKACKNSPDPQRYYYCKACRAYHTTSETKQEYYDNLKKILKRDTRMLEAKKDPLADYIAASGRKTKKERSIQNP